MWYDHGLGKGGSLIDFGLLYYNCSVKELIEKLSTSLSFHQQTLTVQQPLTYCQKPQEALEPKIKVIAAKPLTNPALCRYLDNRKIPLEIAKKYCKEVDFELHSVRNFAIGFENKSGGFEFRNKLFKGSSSPKDVTQNGCSEAKEIAVFEGFCSFLSYQAIHQQSASELTNFLILNSLSFFEKSRQSLEQYQKINLYLDRDAAGINCTQKALKWDVKYTDKSNSYQKHKDLNDYLVHQKKQQKQRFKLRRHF